MNQPSMPTKTKIAAWAMLIIGILCTLSLTAFLIINISIDVTHTFILRDSPQIAALVMITFSPSIYLISPVISNLYVLESFEYRHLGVYKASDFFFYFPYSAYLPYLTIAILLFLFGLLLLKRKKWAWWGAILFLIIEIWFVTYQLILAYPGENLFIYYNPTLYISGVLIILLVLDKNNYLKTLAKS